MKTIDEIIIEQVDSKVDLPIVTAKFGDNWKLRAKEYDKDAVINIAWTQGRRAILLERLLRECFKSLTPKH